MKIVLKYFKKFIIPIIFIILFLSVQALCDLSLPSYTSDIINKGIGQNGINNSVMKVMTKSSYDSLLELSEDKDIITSSYEMISKDDLSDKEYNSYLKKYPLIEKENIYILINENKLLENEIDHLILLESIQNEEFKKMLGDVSIQNIDDIPESITDSIIIEYVKNEYTKVGIDINKMQTDYIFSVGFKMLIIAFLSMLMTVIVGFIGAKIAALFAKNVREDVYKKILSFSNVEMKKFGVSSLITRSTNDISQIQTLIVMFVRMVVYAPIVAIGAIIKVVNTNVSMSWTIVLAVSVILSLILTLFFIASPKFDVIQKMLDKLNLTTREIISGIPVIRAFRTEKYEEKRFDKVNKDLMKTNLFVERVMSLLNPVMTLVMNGVAILIVYNGAFYINDGIIGLGDVMAFIQYTMQIIMSFLMMSVMSIILPRALVSIKRIGEVLKTEVEIKDPMSSKDFILEKEGYVEFKNVSFKYPDASLYILKDISFTAKPGEITAIIGGTGSGKSTLVNLIPRLYDVTQGEVLVNGVNVCDVSLKKLNSVIGYVAQKGVLFSGTIKENITYGNSEASDELIASSIRVAQASRFVNSKDENYDYMISQGGSNVSGGQKQRLSIARAIASEPLIYIFDDSFSALDYKTDKELRKDLKEHTAMATVLIVTQRINTIINADQIVVLNEGKVVGIGKHTELLEKCSVYKEIAESQLSKEELMKKID